MRYLQNADKPVKNYALTGEFPLSKLLKDVRSIMFTSRLCGQSSLSQMRPPTMEARLEATMEDIGLTARRSQPDRPRADRRAGTVASVARDPLYEVRCFGIGR